MRSSNTISRVPAIDQSGVESVVIRTLDRQQISVSVDRFWDWRAQLAGDDVAASGRAKVQLAAGGADDRGGRAVRGDVVGGGADAGPGASALCVAVTGSQRTLVLRGGLYTGFPHVSGRPEGRPCRPDQCLAVVTSGPGPRRLQAGQGLGAVAEQVPITERVVAAAARARRRDNPGVDLFAVRADVRPELTHGEDTSLP